jgi:PST family polysaccharide transporter
MHPNPSPPTATPTGHDSLAQRTVTAFTWRLASESSRLILQLAVQIILARLLPVEAFGLLAAAMVVVNFGSRLSEIGVAPAIIQRATLSPVHVRVGFWIAILSGVVMSAGIWAGAPLAASVFTMAAVTPVLRALGLTFAIAAVGATAEALLQRQMDYRRLLVVEVVSHGLGYGALGIVLALAGAGVWALVWATLAQATIKSSLLLVVAPHSIRPALARREASELLRFGVGMTMSRLATFAAQNGDYFVVGRWLGAAALGLYTRAYQVMCLPIYQFSGILNVVLFPAYSSIQTDLERLRRGYLTSLAVSSLVVFPVLTLTAVIAPELMTGVFGPQWAPAVRPLQILCVGGACYCIYNLADSLVRARGVVYVKFAYHTVYAISVVLATYTGSRYGIVGVSIGVVAAIGVIYLLMAHLSLRLTHCSWRAFLRAQAAATMVSAVVAAVGMPIALASRAAALDPIVSIAMTTLASGVAALLAVFSLPAQWHCAAVQRIVSRARQQATALRGRAITWRVRLDVNREPKSL